MTRIQFDGFMCVLPHAVTVISKLVKKRKMSKHYRIQAAI